MTADEVTPVKVTGYIGGAATTGTKPYGVEIAGELWRDARGVGRRFGSYETAEKAGIREWMRRRVQP